MFKNPSFLFDILCTAAWIVLTVRYARKGFLASMVQLLGNGLSLLGAHQLSSACAGWVFEHLLAGGFRTQIAASLAAGGVVDLTGIAGHRQKPPIRRIRKAWHRHTRRAGRAYAALTTGLPSASNALRGLALSRAQIGHFGHRTALPPRGTFSQNWIISSDVCGMGAKDA